MIPMKILTAASDLLLLPGLAYPLAAAVYSFIGLLRGEPSYPEAPPRRFAVLICARNEENVIGHLLDSLAGQDYPKELVSCFVVAHNCTDRTEHIARGHGATVFACHDGEKSTKGAALRFGVGQIIARFPGQFDALCFFDADNLAERSFLREINAALSAGADAATGFRRSKNYHQNAVSELFGAYWYQIMYTQNLPYSVLGLPVFVGGTGFAVTMESLKDGWATETLLEDIEFTLQMALKGKKILFAPGAVFYDEQPADLKTGWRQRYRWACGGYQLLSRYLPRLLRSIPAGGRQITILLPYVLINPVMLLALLGVAVRTVIGYICGGAAGGRMHEGSSDGGHAPSCRRLLRKQGKGPGHASRRSDPGDAGTGAGHSAERGG